MLGLPQEMILALLLFASHSVPSGPGEDCLSCHAQVTDAKIVHPPVANGLCAACHESASATAHHFKMRLDGAALCRQCHGPRDTEAVLHNPVKEGLCLNCHDPHRSNHHARLRESIKNTCTSCHPSKRLQDAHAATRHGALDETQNPLVCVACHDAHQSPFPKRLKADPPAALCVRCHDRQLVTETGPIIDIAGLLAANPDERLRHGPVREGKCPACHEPHGTDNWRMLKGTFPATFYSPLDEPEATYGLCFGCHDKTLLAERFIKAAPKANADASPAWAPSPVGDRLTRDGVTGFRNGDENLHWRHVNKPDKGRTCRACHDFHASPLQKHIRPSTRFGGWEFKLNYEKTETGGSCGPGCHVRRSYDRAQKQDNPL